MILQRRKGLLRAYTPTPHDFAKSRMRRYTRDTGTRPSATRVPRERKETPTATPSTDSFHHTGTEVVHHTRRHTRRSRAHLRPSTSSLVCQVFGGNRQNPETPSKTRRRLTPRAVAATPSHAHPPPRLHGDENTERPRRTERIQRTSRTTVPSRGIPPPGAETPETHRESPVLSSQPRGVGRRRRNTLCGSGDR